MNIKIIKNAKKHSLGEYPAVALVHKSLQTSCMDLMSPTVVAKGQFECKAKELADLEFIKTGVNKGYFVERPIIPCKYFNIRYCNY